MEQNLPVEFQNTRVSDQAIREAGLLLHACCGPCAEYPLRDLMTRGIEPHLYFANPNIHPAEEWQMRWEGLKQVAESRQLPLSSEILYDEAAWIQFGESPARCLYCYDRRMELAAKKAKELGLHFFTTTLLVSPYQNREAILKSGRTFAERYGLQFLEEDWRPHFREGQKMAKEEGIYRQKYCGCIFSLRASDFRESSERRQGDFVPEATTPSREELWKSAHSSD